LKYRHDRGSFHHVGLRVLGRAPLGRYPIEPIVDIVLNDP
jgi:hypothetical protein